MKSQNETWSEYLGRLDQAIRQGQWRSVRKELLQIDTYKVPRSMMATLAQLTRRVDLVFDSLKILSPIIRSENLASPPSQSEFIEYAASLIRSGNTEEALEILKPLEKNPEALFYQSLAYTRVWEYKKCIPLLLEFIESLEISNYRRLVGITNLVAAYLFVNDFEKAETYLNILRTHTNKSETRLLFTNALELSAQLQIFQLNFKKAEDYLNFATKALGGDSGLSSLLVKKWRTILSVYKNQNKARTIKSLNLLKKDALNLSEWETLRECDLYLSKLLNDKAIYRKILFGTPYAEYRNKIKNLVQSDESLPPSYLWSPFEENHDAPIFDLINGQEVQRNVALAPGSTQHRALQILCLDFYRPAPLGYLFSRLYPGEYFNPFTSPDRILKVIQRLRNWFKSHQIPLSVQFSNGVYSLIGKGPYRIKVYLNGKVVNQRDVFLEKLKKKFPYQSFSRHKAVKALNVSPVTAYRVLNEALERGELSRWGGGRSTSYRFTAEPTD